MNLKFKAKRLDNGEWALVSSAKLTGRNIHDTKLER